MLRDHADFLTRFYTASDNPTDHDGYSRFFTANAKLTMGLKTVNGTSGILALREGMWAAVATRHHVVTKVFHSPDTDELMLHGTVDYTLENGGGRALTSEWAARMVFAPESGGEKMREYQVYLDASPMVVAQGKSIVPDESGNVKIV